MYRASDIERVLIDKDLIFVVKPRGLLTQKTRGSKEEETNLEDILGYKAVNRLDRRAYGLILMTRDENYYHAARRIWNKSSEKLYWIITKDKLAEKDHTFKCFKRGNKVYLARPRDLGLRKTYPCVSLVLQSFKIGRFWGSRVRNLTGFTHQLRMLAKFNGTYILGEDLYRKCKFAKDLMIEAYSLKAPSFQDKGFERHNKAVLRTSRSWRSKVVKLWRDEGGSGFNNF